MKDAAPPRGARRGALAWPCCLALLLALTTLALLLPPPRAGRLDWLRSGGASSLSSLRRIGLWKRVMQAESRSLGDALEFGVFTFLQELFSYAPHVSKPPIFPLFSH